MSAPFRISYGAALEPVAKWSILSVHRSEKHRRCIEGEGEILVRRPAHRNATRARRIQVTPHRSAVTLMPRRRTFVDGRVREHCEGIWSNGAQHAPDLARIVRRIDAHLQRRCLTHHRRSRTSDATKVRIHLSIP